MGYGTGVDSQTQTNTSSIFIGFDQSSSFTANTFGNFEVYIPNYTSANNKSLSADSVTEDNASSVYGMSLVAGLWANTDAITSILVQDIAGGSNLAQYSTARLYGIKNS